MIKGIYTSAAGMSHGVLRQEATAGNLANSGTTGYRGTRLFVQDLIRAQDESEAATSAGEARSWTDFAAGALDPTGSALDVALQSKGFFVTSDGQREIYTRNGHFERDVNGILVDALGRNVLGEGGNITLPPGTVTVTSDGRISVEGVLIDRLRIVSFDDPQPLVRVAGAAFQSDSSTASPVPVESPGVRQGFLESSNVDAVREMVDMIATARHYEVNAKVLTAQDDSLRHVVGELGRV